MDDKLKCESDLKTAMKKSNPWDRMPHCRSYLVRLGVHEFTQDKGLIDGAEPTLSFELSKYRLSVSSKSHANTWRFRAALAQQLGSQDLIRDLMSSANVGPLNYNFDVAGGKSGSGFATMGKFPVKYGLRMGDGAVKYMNEPENFEALAPLLTARFTEDDELGEFDNQRMPSLLNKLYFMLHLQVGSVVKHKLENSYSHFVLILEDAFYGLPQVANLYNVPFMKFDLKGRSREEGNQGFVAKFPRADGAPDDPWGGQLPLSTTACNYLLSALMVDILKVFGRMETGPRPRFMIDYSLLVGVVDLRAVTSRIAAYEVEKRCAAVGEPLCFIVQANEDARPMMITFSVIDYLNDLNDSKAWESYLIGLKKFMKFQGFQAKFELYNRQILDFASWICRPSTLFDKLMNLLSDKEDFEEFLGSNEHLRTLSRSWL